MSDFPSFSDRYRDVEFKRADHLIGIRQAKLAREAIDAIC